MLVSANLLNKVVTEVACGSHHSMALTNTGEVSVEGRGFNFFVFFGAPHLKLEADSVLGSYICGQLKLLKGHIESVWKREARTCSC